MLGPVAACGDDRRFRRAPPAGETCDEAHRSDQGHVLAQPDVVAQLGRQRDAVLCVRVNVEVSEKIHCRVVPGELAAVLELAPVAAPLVGGEQRRVVLDHRGDAAAFGADRNIDGMTRRPLPSIVCSKVP